MQCLQVFTISCLNILDETGAVRSEVCHVVRSLLECIRKNGSCGACEIYSLDTHLDILFSSCWKTEINMQHYEESKFCSGSGFSHNVYWAAQERSALYFTKNMLRERKYWEAYRAGMYACQEGAWFAAAFTFRKLMDRVQSEFFRSWIRSLMLLAGAESEIKLILFPEVGIEMINRMQTKSDCEKAFDSVERGKECKGGDINLHASSRKFTKIHSRICSSEEILSASEATDGVYYFQRWFLSLRSKVLDIITDMLRLFDSHASNEKRLDKGLEGNMKTPFNLQALHAITSDFVKLSLKLNGIAKEYDLLAVSFLDIDHKSFRNISRQALSCSVLAFCTSFALFFLNSPAHKNALSSDQGDMVKISQTKVLKDLTERLWNLDEKSATELQKLMAIHREVAHNLQSRTESNNCVLIDRAALLVYKCCITGTLDIQEDSKGVKDEEGLLRLCSKGIRMLSGIIERWIEIPCSIPKFFFRIRTCVGAELFIFNTDSSNPNRLSITPGSQLSLNLCLQLKSSSRVPLESIAKIYCILVARPSDHLLNDDGKIGKEKQWLFQASKSDEIVELYDILLHHIRINTMQASRKRSEVDDGGLVTSFVYFEPNDKGQGFSTCLLDVSAFPEGSYPIKWHSCCADKKGHYWSLLPSNLGLFFTIKNS